MMNMNREKKGFISLTGTGENNAPGHMQRTTPAYSEYDDYIYAVQVNILFGIMS